MKNDEEWQLFFQLCSVFPEADQVFIAEKIADAAEKDIASLSEGINKNDCHGAEFMSL